MTIDPEERALRTAAAVEPIGPGRYAVTLSPVYTVMGHPHGGYLQCVMGAAALAAASDEGASHLHVTAITTSYVGASEVGPAEVRTEVRRVGRGASFVHATLFQNDVLLIESLVTMGTLRDDAPVRYQDAEHFEVAPLEECLRSTGLTGINIMSAAEQRLDPHFDDVVDRRGIRAGRNQGLAAS